MKRIVAVIIVLLGLTSLAPILVGHQARKYTENHVRQMQELPGNDITLVDYQQGYLSSTAQLRIKADTNYLESILRSNEADQDDEIAMQLLEFLEQGLLVNAKIAHGPITVASKSEFLLFHASFELDGVAKDFFRQAEEALALDEALLSADLYMGFDGKGEMIIHSPAFAVEEGVEKINFGGMDLSATIFENGKRISYTGEIHATSFYSEYSEVSIEPMVFSGTTTFGVEQKMGTGDMLMTLASVTVELPEASMSIEDMELEMAVTTPAADTVSLDYRVGFGLLEVTGLPESISNFNAAVAMNNLNSNALMKFSDQSLFANPVSNPMMFQAQYLELLSELFSNDPELLIREFGFEMGPQVMISLDGSLAFANNALADPMAMQAPFILLNDIVSELNLEFSQGFLSLFLDNFIENQMNSAQLPVESRPQFEAQMRAQIQMGIDQSVQVGYLSKEGDRYTLHASMSQGMLQVNDMTIPLPF